MTDYNNLWEDEENNEGMIYFSLVVAQLTLYIILFESTDNPDVAQSSLLTESMYYSNIKSS